MKNKPFIKNKKEKSSKKAKQEDSAIEFVPDSHVNVKHVAENIDENDDQFFQDLKVEKQKKKKSGGFQSMGLSQPVLKGIFKKGYKLPTPIQRKAIPLVMEGKDVVGMARTGSGKTAAFVVPMLEKIRKQEGKVGVKGLILSPTRELALQTYLVTKELARFTGLKVAVILGGDKMEDQFAMMHDSPDIIVATPGRLLHVLVEMDAKLQSAEYVVFDEADRLFEMGFQEQLNEIINRLPSNRQTLLFSATLPQLLVDFAKAGLHDPELIRLDVELKLSENLKTVYLACKAEDKMALLLHLLKSVVKSDEMTVVFTATRHHVEFLKDLLAKAGIKCTYVYSALDHEARQMNISAFRSKKVRIMLVTDVAARGIDIPLLDNVINYNFPAKPKLFVHRVGRVARAGRSGTAYSLIASDEAPFLHELHLFLDLQINVAKCATNNAGIYGFAPQQIIDEENDVISRWLESDFDLQSMQKVCSNAYKQYCKTRQNASGESVRQMKEYDISNVGIHPIFESKDVKKKCEDTQRNSLLDSLKNFRPNSTIFEINAVKKNKCFEVMKTKRKAHEKFVKRKKELDSVNEMQTVKSLNGFKDSEFYLPYKSDGHETEKGLQLEKKTLFDDAVFDILGDDSELIRKQNSGMKWDRKKKKFIRENDSEPKNKKIKTESGAWISASYKSDLYKKWKERSRLRESDSESNEEDVYVKQRNKALTSRKRMKQKEKLPRNELRSKEQILKTRLTEEKKRKFDKWRKEQRGRGTQKSARRGGTQKHETTLKMFNCLFVNYESLF
ncbi:ATP-dependent RNA helicase DDX54-like protein [Leptotrombidium deliense]|uniref:RNA helicase n=1 Tax=Leptotrombidium deliense TaxID=299467 RepID=A0A443SVS6_9ACAR|nr:ATP-dependent RNA helicase DDX54-like protein [Leptotrombidium deliense]